MRRDISTDDIGQGYGLQGEDVGEGEFGDLREVEAVALEYLGWMLADITCRGHPEKDKHFSMPYHN